MTVKSRGYVRNRHFLCRACEGHRVCCNYRSQRISEGNAGTRSAVLRDPAARTAYPVAFIPVMIVMEYAYGGKAVHGYEIVHLFHCGPPVIVIALGDYLFSGERVYELQILV